MKNTRWCEVKYKIAMTNVFDTAVQVIPIVISILAFVKSNKVETIQKQEKQERVHTDLNRLLEARSNFFSTENEIIGCSLDVPKVSREEEDKIKREVFRYFGKKEYTQLCEILSLCEETTEINESLRILFETIRSQEEYEKIKEALQSKASDKLSDEDQELLDTLCITKYSDDGKIVTYDYKELDEQLLVTSVKIRNKQEALKRI